MQFSLWSMYWKILLYLYDLLYLQYYCGYEDVRQKSKREKIQKCETPSLEAIIFIIGGYTHCTIVCIFQDICSYVRNLILFLLHSQQESKSVSL